jgi:4'-phosphopantetheinyl transferase EntD
MKTPKAEALPGWRVEPVAAAIRERLPSGVGFSGGPSTQADDTSFTYRGNFPELASASPKRRREFRLGRFHAQRALASIGVEGAVVGRGSDRAPLWPSGVVGSITHCEAYCAAVVAPEARMLAIGLDLETADAMEPGLWRMIAGVDELEAAAAAAALPLGEAAKLLFSIKEAFYKAYWPVAGRFVDFLQARATVGPGLGKFEVAIADDQLPAIHGRRVLAGEYGRKAGLCFALALLPANPGVAEDASGPHESTSSKSVLRVGR